MKAMLTDQEHNLVWSDVEEPQVKADSVLIEVHAAAVNRADILQRQGKYPSPAGCPQWMGLEVAGVVVKTGAAVTRWKVGGKPAGGICDVLSEPLYRWWNESRGDRVLPGWQQRACKRRNPNGKGVRSIRHHNGAHG